MGFEHMSLWPPMAPKAAHVCKAHAPHRIRPSAIMTWQKAIPAGLMHNACLGRVADHDTRFVGTPGEAQIMREGGSAKRAQLREGHDQDFQGAPCLRTDNRARSAPHDRPVVPRKPHQMRRYELRPTNGCLDSSGAGLDTATKQHLSASRLSEASKKANGRGPRHKKHFETTHTHTHNESKRNATGQL